MATHGLAATGTGGTTAKTYAAVGSDITFPAGGPWTVFGVWCLVAQTTAVEKESLDGTFRIQSKSGDIVPDPAPGVYPVIGVDAPMSASYGNCAMALNIWPVNWEASGKAVITMEHSNWNVLAVAPRVVAGVLFGDSVPEPRPLTFCDGVQEDSTATTETTLGTVTIAEKATRIVGILSVISNTGTATVDDPCIGTVRLASDDVPLAPAVYPFCRSIQPGDGTIAGQSSSPQAQFIPVDIPVPGGSRVVCYGTSNVACAGGASMAVFLAYE